MSKTYQAAGHTLSCVAPSGGVVTGLGYVIGTMFVIAENDAAVGEPFEGTRRGVHRLPKTASETPAQGADAYWDATADSVTTVVGSNTLIGHYAAAAAANDATCLVVLDQ